MGIFFPQFMDGKIAIFHGNPPQKIRMDFG
jgi:hypothetical protein